MRGEAPHHLGAPAPPQPQTCVSGCGRLGVCVCSPDEWWAEEGCFPRGRSRAPGSHPDLQPRTRHFLTSRKLRRLSSSDPFFSTDLLLFTVNSTPAKHLCFLPQRLPWSLFLNPSAPCVCPGSPWGKPHLGERPARRGPTPCTPVSSCVCAARGSCASFACISLCHGQDDSWVSACTPLLIAEGCLECVEMASQ